MNRNGEGKLYVVVRSDLKPGLQAAQACHAMRLFSAEQEVVDRAWYEGSNNLVLLQVSGERELLELRTKADDCPSALFREPDLDGEATAMAMGPSARKFVSSLPLLLKGA